MRRPSISLPTLVRKPQLSRAQLPHAAGAVVLLFAIATAVMSLSSSAHAWFDWVPVSNDQIVIDSALTLLMAIFLLVIAAAVILPLTMAIHTIGHATAGYFFGMRLLAVRVGPVLFTPWTVGNRFEFLPISGKTDLMTGWSQFDDSPLPTWKRLRGWQVMTVGGSGMNLLVSLVFSIMSIFASGVTYVLFREMVWLNLAACIVNLIPFVLPSLDFASDGKHLLALLLDADDGADALIEKLRDQVVVGPLRPASWPREREAAWEAKLRQTPATAEGRAEQMETMVYLFLQGIDRGDTDVAWRWVQAMHHVIAMDRESDDVAIDTGRVMCALHAARWEKNAESAQTLLDSVSKTSGMRFSGWYAAANTASLWAAATAESPEITSRLLATRAGAELAIGQLRNPARLHGVDQLMLGIVRAIEGDVEVEMQRRSIAVPVAQEQTATETAAADVFGQQAVA
jgi:hypothetical protein